VSGCAGMNARDAGMLAGAAVGAELATRHPITGLVFGGLAGRVAGSVYERSVGPAIGDNPRGYGYATVPPGGRVSQVETANPCDHLPSYGERAACNSARSRAEARNQRAREHAAREIGRQSVPREGGWFY
jgi:hypothetical protein